MIIDQRIISLSSESDVMTINDYFTCAVNLRGSSGSEDIGVDLVCMAAT